MTTGNFTGYYLNDEGGNSVAVQSDGKIVVAGSSVGGSGSDFAVARYEGTRPSVSGAQTTNLSSVVTFTVTATRLTPLSYQWKKNGVDIPGATASSYTIPSAQPWHIGDYTVVITDSIGGTESDPALLQIAAIPTAVWRGLVSLLSFRWKCA